MSKKNKSGDPRKRSVNHSKRNDRIIGNWNDLQQKVIEFDRNKLSDSELEIENKVIQKIFENNTIFDKNNFTKGWSSNTIKFNCKEVPVSNMTYGILVNKSYECLSKELLKENGIIFIPQCIDDDYPIYYNGHICEVSILFSLAPESNNKIDFSIKLIFNEHDLIFDNILSCEQPNSFEIINYGIPKKLFVGYKLGRPIGSYMTNNFRQELKDRFGELTINL